MRIVYCKRRALPRPVASPGNSYSPITLRLTSFTTDIHAHSHRLSSRVSTPIVALSSCRLPDHCDLFYYS
uniref:Uncharacterized protein n=1 Tax=Caenorhabditis japonica TaxID=281687 RepID=A0A8R1EIL9_CAEJA